MNECPDTIYCYKRSSYTFENLINFILRSLVNNYTLVNSFINSILIITIVELFYFILSPFSCRSSTAIFIV